MRGYATKTIQPNFEAVVNKLNSESATDKMIWYRRTSSIPGHIIFSHRVYYPLDISRRKIWTAYDKTCNNNITEKSLPFSFATRKYTFRTPNVMVKYNHPKNLQNLLTLSKMHEAQGRQDYDAITAIYNPTAGTLSTTLPWHNIPL